jgi:hypothetical protein
MRFASHPLGKTGELNTRRPRLRRKLESVPGRRRAAQKKTSPLRKTASTSAAAGAVSAMAASPRPETCAMRPTYDLDIRTKSTPPGCW